ncbi:histidine--tRNA ligase [candidate division KSB1 bacterium]|nr:histidine--tRNA ligase [candidate division KSB1 bacterium]
MAKRFQNPKGTRDVLPEEQHYWRRIESVFQRLSDVYGFEKLTLPIFEETSLFQRGVGETTDIVEKEMYTFEDKGGNSMTLRPEFTAGVVRSYIQNGMASLTNPVKVWSTGPVFRYERPQAGRYRQFTQFNVEAFGEIDPALDFEVMSLAWQLYDELQFKNLSFQLNSIGCPVCRPGYLEQLKSYYHKNLHIVCDDCKSRLDKNPLRLLDCKNVQCQPTIQSAPAMKEHLCAECDDHFKTLLGYLDDMKRPYVINPRLVRGLDYYTKTVFEVWAEGIGAQNAVCGGGRYDGLAEMLGGKPTPGIGFAAGLERIVLTMQNQGVEVDPIPGPRVYFAPMGDAAKRASVRLITELRLQGIESVIGFGGRSFKALMREANRRGVRLVCIMGEEEISKNVCQVKDMEGGEQKSISLEEVIPAVKEILSAGS